MPEKLGMKAVFIIDFVGAHGLDDSLDITMRIDMTRGRRGR
jgi:hypothetical protein